MTAGHIALVVVEPCNFRARVQVSDTVAVISVRCATLHTHREWFSIRVCVEMHFSSLWMRVVSRPLCELGVCLLIPPSLTSIPFSFGLPSISPLVISQIWLQINILSLVSDKLKSWRMWRVAFFRFVFVLIHGVTVGGDPWVRCWLASNTNTALGNLSRWEDKLRHPT